MVASALHFSFISTIPILAQSFSFMPEIKPQPFGGVLFVQRNVTGPLDLDRDRRIDFVLSGWSEVVPSGTQEHIEAGRDAALFRFRPTP